jgi:hypothetical protein
MFGLFKSVKRSVLAVTAAAAVCAAVGLAAPAMASQTPARAQVAPVAITHTTAKELAWLRTEMANPKERTVILTDLQTAFKGVGKVGVGAVPGATSGAHGVTSDIAAGHDSTHFWITASYADIADGAIWGAVVACEVYLEPIAGVCEIAGETLVDWSQGWGRAANHGVWAAIYWLPPHFTGGRW